MVNTLYTIRILFLFTKSNMYASLANLLCIVCWRGLYLEVSIVTLVGPGGHRSELPWSAWITTGRTTECCSRNPGWTESIRDTKTDTWEVRTHSIHSSYHYYWQYAVECCVPYVHGSKANGLVRWKIREKLIQSVIEN